MIDATATSVDELVDLVLANADANGPDARALIAVAGTRALIVNAVIRITDPTDLEVAHRGRTTLVTLDTGALIRIAVVDTVEDAHKHAGAEYTAVATIALPELEQDPDLVAGAPLPAGYLTEYLEHRLRGPVGTRLLTARLVAP